MIKDLEIPEGKSIKVAKGGPETLRKILTLLSKRGFTGYVKIESKEGKGSGFIIMRGGSRAMTLFYGTEGFFTGKAALPSFKALVKDHNTFIEVHAGQTLEPLMESLRRRRGKPQPAVGAFRRKLEEWKAQGHDVEELEAIMGQSLSKVIKAFADYKEGMKEDVMEELEGVSVIKGREAKRSETKAEDHQKKKTKKRAKSPKSPPRKPSPKKKSSSKKRTRGRKSESVAEAPKKVEAVVEAPSSSKTGLLDKYTFEGFLVGDSNRFAHAACVTVAEGSVEPYSPLFLVGGTGLGKTHLLQALGRRFAEKNADGKLRYLTGTQFRDEVEKATTEGQLAEFRKSFLDLDVLLLDDAQDMRGRRSAQEEFFAIFEEFHQKGKPIALAADRRPAEMQELDSRLISRFESGLVADIQPPNPEVRIAFLRGRIGARSVSVPERVVKYLADRFTVDLRELEGAFNRVLAYSQAIGKPVNMSVVKGALGQPTSTPAPEPLPAPTFDPMPGHSYLSKEEAGDSAYRLFAKRARHVKGLLITRTNPSRVKETHRMEGTEILWLTDRSESSENTVGPVLERLMYKVESFMITGGQGIILLDGVEYLKSNNGFEAVLKFIRRLVDDISESDFTFILTVNPATLEMRELRILENELENHPA